MTAVSPEVIEWQTGKPPGDGRYKAQDYSVNCDCCWIDAEYKKGQWIHNKWGGWQVLVVTRWAHY